MSQESIVSEGRAGNLGQGVQGCTSQQRLSGPLLHTVLARRLRRLPSHPICLSSCHCCLLLDRWLPALTSAAPCPTIQFQHQGFGRLCGHNCTKSLFGRLDLKRSLLLEILHASWFNQAQQMMRMSLTAYRTPLTAVTQRLKQVILDQHACLSRVR